MRYFDLLPRLVTESGYKTLLIKTEEIRIEKRVLKIENWKFENKKIINESEKKKEKESWAWEIHQIITEIWSQA